MNNTKENEDNVTKFTRDNFSNFNFPKQNDGSFTVFVQNELADAWEEALEKKYGEPIIESSSKGKAFGKNWKTKFTVEDMHVELTIHFYNKPLSKPKRSKILIQGGNKHNQSMLHFFVFEELPLIYEVISSQTRFSKRKRLNTPVRRRNTRYKSSSKVDVLNCALCDFTSVSNVSVIRHMKTSHTLSGPSNVVVQVQTENPKKVEPKR